MTMSDESRAPVAQPIVVDMAKTVQQLSENPDLARQMNELVFGKFAADQLAARDAIIEELVEALSDAAPYVPEHHGPIVARINAAMLQARGH